MDTTLDTTLTVSPNQSLAVDGEGRKFDIEDEKIRLELVPPCFVTGMGRVLTSGAIKYDADNWMRGMAFRRVLGAMKRHLNAIEKGEDYDPESGELHAYHLACGTAFLSYYQSHYATYNQFDDRVFAPAEPRQ